jgi:hypothetical protein
MCGLLELTWVKPRHWTCPVPRPDSSNHLQTYSAPSPDMSVSLWHPNRKIPLGGYKMSITPPSLSLLLHCFENTLNQHFLSSKSLSFKLHSNPSFLREIWAIILSVLLNLQAKHFTNDPYVFITLEDLSPRWTRYYPGVTKVVVNLRKFVLSSPSWGFDSEKPN